MAQRRTATRVSPPQLEELDDPVRSLLHAVLAGLLPVRPYTRPSQHQHRQTIHGASFIDARSAQRSAGPTTPASPCRLPPRTARARGVSPPPAPSPLLLRRRLCSPTASTRRSRSSRSARPATAFYVVCAVSRCTSGQGCYVAGLRSVLDAPRCAPHCVLLRQSRQRMSSSSGSLGTPFSTHLPARDGGRMPRRHRLARSPRLRRLRAHLSTPSGRCA